MSLHDGRRLAAVSVAANAILSVASLVAGSEGASRSVKAAGVEFGADVIASLMVLAGFWYASRPADDNHPYGHGRAETLTGLVIGLALFAIGSAIAVDAARHLGKPHPVPALWAMWPIVIALGVKATLMTVKLRTGRRTASQALMADAWNDSVDVLSSLAAITALGLTLYDPTRFAASDQVGAILVGVLVIVAGLGVVRNTSQDLIDTMPPASVLDDVRTSALAVAGVRGVEKLLGRKTGLQYHIDMHLEVDGWISVDEGHAIAARVRERIRQGVDAVSDVLVHVEPHSPKTLPKN